MRRAAQIKEARPWPTGHLVQLGLIMFILQPVLLIFTLIDFARTLDEHAPFLWRCFAHMSRILRPGARSAQTDGQTLVWEAMLGLFGIFLTQAWYCTRMQSWLHVAEGHELGEDAAALKKRQRSAHAQVEVCLFLILLIRV